MKKLSIKSIIEFKRKSDRSRKTFVAALKATKAKADEEGGRDYWITCLSAISNSFKMDNPKFISDKIDELEEKNRRTDNKRTKSMFERNIYVLHNYEDFYFKKWKPSKKIIFLRKNKDDSVLKIKGFEVLATPHHVFKFYKGEAEEVGAIWFIAKLNGFRGNELGMFTDILNRYLKDHFSKDYVLNSKYCIAVDVFNNAAVNYSQFEKGEVSSILNSTLEEIKKLI